MAPAFSDSFMVSGGWKHLPKISRATKGITMKFLPDVGSYKEAQNQKYFWHSWSGLYIKDQNPENPDFWKCNL